jgi:hypothetical protein
VPLAMWLKTPNCIQMNIDKISDDANACLQIRPILVQPDWNFKTTRAYLCDLKTGDRIKEIPWMSSTGGNIEIPRLEGSIILDLECMSLRLQQAAEPDRETK